MKVADPKYDGKVMSIVITQKDELVKATLVGTGVTLEYEKEDIDTDNTLNGMVKVIIHGDKNLEKDIEIKISNGKEIICEGKAYTEVMECSTQSHKAYSLNVSVFKKGWFSDTVYLNADIHKINGHKVTINLTKNRSEIVDMQ